MSGTAWTSIHNWGTGEVIYSAFLNQTVQDAYHLKQRGDALGTVSGTAIFGQVVVPSGTATQWMQTTTLGQAGPVYAVLEPLNSGTPGYVRLQGSADVLVGSAVTPGQFLQASTSSGTALPTTDYTAAFAVALGSAGAGSPVAAQLLAWPNGRLAGTPAYTLGTANAPGTAGQFVRTDATLLAFDSTAPTTITVGGASAVGTATTAARRDHAHAGTALTGTLAGTPALTFGTANAIGAASTFVRTDATLLAFDATTPATETVGGSGTVGTATVAARRDHKHPITALALTDLPILTKVYSSSGSVANPTTTSASLVNLDGTGQGTVLRVDGTCAANSSGTLLCWVNGAFQCSNTFTMGLALNFNSVGGVTLAQAHAPFAGGQANLAAPTVFVGTAGSAFSVVAMWNTSGGTATAVNTARNLLVVEVLR